MICDFTCSPGSACHPTPYRGGEGGKQKQCASLPVMSMGGGKLASYNKSISYGPCRQSSLPLKSSLPPYRTTTNVRQAQKQPVSRSRVGFQEANEQAAHIIAANPVNYPGVMQTWAALVLEKAAPTIKGPLFSAA